MKAELFNAAGIAARWLGDQFSRLHLWLYGISGSLDGMADNAGYWARHDAPKYEA